MAAQRINLQDLCVVLQQVTYDRIVSWLQRNQLGSTYQVIVRCYHERPAAGKPKRITIVGSIYQFEPPTTFHEHTATEHMPLRKATGDPLLPETLWYEFEQTYFTVLSELRTYVRERHNRKFPVR